MPNLAENKKCTGCSACMNACTHNAIKMRQDQEGFLYPNIECSSCTDCGLCEKVCPVLNPNPSKNLTKPKVFAMWSEQDRMKSSSGGAFSAFARVIISKGGKVFGAAFDGHLNLRHMGISTENELCKLRGSKYIQSDVAETFKGVKDILQEGLPVLYSGTPCQIAGLKAYLRRPYGNLLTVDLVCHGVPSSMVFKSYLSKLQSKKKLCTIESFEFRNLNGWGISASVKTDGKSYHLYGASNLYMEAFNANALFREACYECPFATFPRQGDCSIGDFWGIGRYGMPFKHDVMKGVSLVLVNNERGESVMREIRNSFVEERSLEETLKENRNISRPSKRNPYRNDVIIDFLDEKMSLSAIDRKYHIVDKSLKGTVKMYTSKLGLSGIVKRIYNKYRMS